jgi:hypothetical protein
MHIVVLKGRGRFTVDGKTELDAGANSLLVLDPEESIEGKALGGDLVFLEVLHGAQS